MENFPANSRNVLGPKGEKEKPKKEPVQKIVTGEVIQKPKSLGTKFKEIFIDRAFKGALKYIGSDVLLPALKNMAVDATSKGVEKMVYGDVGPRQRYRGYGYEPGRPRVSYNSPVERFPQRPAMLPGQPPYGPSTRGPAPRAGEIIISSREEAEAVLEGLTDIIDKYEVATVSDLHNLVGLPSSYTDEKWGWVALAYADVRQVREGYIINLPPPEPV